MCIPVNAVVLECTRVAWVAAHLGWPHGGFHIGSYKHDEALDSPSHSIILASSESLVSRNQSSFDATCPGFRSKGISRLF